MEVATRRRKNRNSPRLREGGVSGLSERERVAELVVDHPLGPAARRLAVHRSRKRIAAFRLHVPSTVAEAATLPAEPSAPRVIGGGIDVINRMKAGELIDSALFFCRPSPFPPIALSPT